MISAAIRPAGPPPMMATVGWFGLSWIMSLYAPNHSAIGRKFTVPANHTGHFLLFQQLMKLAWMMHNKRLISILMGKILK
jgi:hypothetical protein